MNVIALPTFSYLVWEERERDGKREGWEGGRERESKKERVSANEVESSFT